MREHVIREDVRNQLVSFVTEYVKNNNVSFRAAVREFAKRTDFGYDLDSYYSSWQHYAYRNKRKSGIITNNIRTRPVTAEHHAGITESSFPNITVSDLLKSYAQTEQVKQERDNLLQVVKEQKKKQEEILKDFNAMKADFESTVEVSRSAMQLYRSLKGFFEAKSRGENIALEVDSSGVVVSRVG